MDKALELIKKYGLSAFLALCFIVQNFQLNSERVEIQKAMSGVTKDTVHVLIGLNNRIDKLQEVNETLIIETKENRYELRVLNEKLGEKPSRRISE